MATVPESLKSGALFLHDVAKHYGCAACIVITKYDADDADFASFVTNPSWATLTAGGPELPLILTEHVVLDAARELMIGVSMISPEAAAVRDAVLAWHKKHHDARTADGLCIVADALWWKYK